MTTVSVRYIMEDVDAAISFYRDHLGFDVVMHPAPSFGMLALGSLRLLLSAPSGEGGGGQAMPGGRQPEPGGWNRFQLQVSGLPAEVDRLRRPVCASGTRSSTVSAATRFWPRTRPETSSSCSRRTDPRKQGRGRWRGWCSSTAREGGPGFGVLAEFGAVDYETRRTFHGILHDGEPDPANPALSVLTGRA